MMKTENCLSPLLLALVTNNSSFSDFRCFCNSYFTTITTHERSQEGGSAISCCLGKIGVEHIDQLGSASTYMAAEQKWWAYYLFSDDVQEVG